MLAHAALTILKELHGPTAFPTEGYEKDYTHQERRAADNERQYQDTDLRRPQKAHTSGPSKLRRLASTARTRLVRWLARQLVPDAHPEAISVLNHDVALLEFLLHRLAAGV